MTFEEAFDYALSLPETEEAASRVEQRVHRGKGMMMKIKHGCMVFRLPWELRDQLLDDHPDRFFVTDHYLGWPYLLAHMDRVPDDQLKMLIEEAWKEAPEKAVVIKEPWRTPTAAPKTKK